MKELQKKRRFFYVFNVLILPGNDGVAAFEKTVKTEKRRSSNMANFAKFKLKVTVMLPK